MISRSLLFVFLLSGSSPSISWGASMHGGYAYQENRVTGECDLIAVLPFHEAGFGVQFLVS